MLTAKTPKCLNGACKTELKFSFGRWGGYKNTHEGEQGGDGEMGGKEEEECGDLLLGDVDL